MFEIIKHFKFKFYLSLSKQVSLSFFEAKFENHLPDAQGYRPQPQLEKGTTGYSTKAMNCCGFYPPIKEVTFIWLHYMEYILIFSPPYLLFCYKYVILLHSIRLQWQTPSNIVWGIFWLWCLIELVQILTHSELATRFLRCKNQYLCQRLTWDGGKPFLHGQAFDHRVLKQEQVKL